MIIKCENCNKKFSINDNLIPESGRLVKCSNCDNTWFYKNNNKIDINPSSIDINLSNKDTINENDIDKNIDNNDNTVNNLDKKININNKKLENESEKVSSNNQNNKKDILKVYFNYILIIIVSFVALILLVDTFKNSLSNYFPGLIVLLDNLYASLSDLILFLKDLFN
tara:strand:- start:322 stop:825 length:504 start_codon:yes stop_codon:yes gene_type:complete